MNARVKLNIDKKVGETTIDAAEIDKFSAMAADWWDPFGKFRPLHKFNPVRLGYIRDAACAHFSRDAAAATPLNGLRLLDIGCGGGLVAEPMARLGAAATAIDASEANIKTALAHAGPLGLDIDYRCAAAEDMLAAGEGPYDIVLNLEVVEHVADVDLFLETSSALVSPGGMLIMATINRTLKALALAKIGAEYILRWLPAGTHDPRKFVKPDDAKDALTRAGLTVIEDAGVSYNPLMDQWRISKDMDVNYMLTAVKPSAPTS